MLTKLPLWKHQEEAIKRADVSAKEGLGFALFFEQGTGKTRTVLEILKRRFQENGFLNTLILAPPVVVPNWKNEISQYTDFPESKILVLSGSGKDKTQQFLERYKRGSSFIVVTNYEALLNTSLHLSLYNWRPGIIVCDEVQKIKDESAKRTKAVLALTARTRFTYILSGTPILNSPMDIFSQFKALDNGKTFGTKLFIFRHMYFMDRNAYMPKHVKFPNWVPKPGALEEINKKIQPLSMRVKKEDCLDLPPFIRQKVFVEMSADQRRVYESMKEDFIAYINDQVCVAKMALTKALRLLQIASGFVTTEEGHEVLFKNNPRLDALRDLLLELTPNHKVIVWACFKSNYHVIRKLLTQEGIEYVELTGETSEKERQTAVDDFQKRDGVRVLLGNPSSGGIGVNLTASDISVYYSRNFSLEADLQSEARNHRGGSERHKSVTRIDLVCPESIDQMVLEKLALKRESGDALVEAKVWEDLVQELKGGNWD